MNTFHIVTCIISLLGVDAATLRGTVDPDHHDQHCFHAALNGDHATCHGATSVTDNTPCVWCALAGGTRGACLSHAQALLTDGTFGLSCPALTQSEETADTTAVEESTAIEESGPATANTTAVAATTAARERGGGSVGGGSVWRDVRCFEAAGDAEDAATACGAATDGDGSACVWCPVKGKQDQAGACLSTKEAASPYASFLHLTCPAASSVGLALAAVVEK